MFEILIQPMHTANQNTRALREENESQNMQADLRRRVTAAACRLWEQCQASTR